MKKLSIFALCLFFVFGAGATEDLAPVDYVNPYIGTHGGVGPSLYGGMIPGVTRPFGMIQWTPMTRLNKIGGCPYRYGDNTIMGFQGTHQPAVWMGDYGHVSVMPGQGDVRVGFKERDVSFSHDEEVTTPYYYKVKMGDMKGEMAASVRSSIMRFSFQSDEAPYMIVDASRDKGFAGSVTIEPDKNRIIGYNSDRHSAHLGPPLPNFKGHFVIEFDKQIEDFGVYRGEETAESVSRAEGEVLGAYVVFKKGVKTVQARIGTSLISLAQAEENLEKEIPGWDLEKIKREGRAEWNKKLGRIEVEGGTRDDKVNFYTSMYHAHLYPRIFSEYGRYYSAFASTDATTAPLTTRSMKAWLTTTTRCGTLSVPNIPSWS